MDTMIIEELAAAFRQREVIDQRIRLLIDGQEKRVAEFQAQVPIQKVLRGKVGKRKKGSGRALLSVLTEAYNAA